MAIVAPTVFWYGINNSSGCFTFTSFKMLVLGLESIYSWHHVLNLKEDSYIKYCVISQTLKWRDNKE